MLTFIGLGLYDERSITIEGRDALREADQVYAEFYTSQLVGADVSDIESYHGIDITVLDRAGVEQDPGPVFSAATRGNVAFLTAGDTMISTTHIDLRLRAAERGITTRIIQAPTAESAASALTGLQNYRFGKATTLPLPREHGSANAPGSVIDTIEDNQLRGLHTLVYLDINKDRDEYMTADVASSVLQDTLDDMLAVVVARAGSPTGVVRADRLSNLASATFGPPLHLLVIPGTLHPIEAEALRTFANAPSSLVLIDRPGNQ